MRLINFPKYLEVPGKVCQTSQKSSQLRLCIETLFHSFPHLPFFSDTSQANEIRCGTGRLHLPLLSQAQAAKAGPKQQESESRGLRGLHLYWSCSPQHATYGGGEKGGRCSSEPQAEVAAAEGLCDTQGAKTFLQASFLTCFHAPLLEKKM